MVGISLNQAALRLRFISSIRLKGLRMRHLCRLSLVSPASCLVACLDLDTLQATYIALSAYKQWYNEAMYPKWVWLQRAIQVACWASVKEGFVDYSELVGLGFRLTCTSAGLSTQLCISQKWPVAVVVFQEWLHLLLLSRQGEMCWRVSGSQGRQQWLSESVNWQE